MVESSEFERQTDRLIAYARELAPRIRERSVEAEGLRRLPDATMADIEPLLPALVPKVWGGFGLGVRVLCEVGRELAHGDASTAWTTTFLMTHNWLACRMPMEAQEEMFADRSFIRSAAPLVPSGRAEPADGGYRVSGTYRYASGVWNADWTFFVAPVFDGEDALPEPRVFMVPLSEVTVNDDWFMSGMAATGSASITVDDVFVPERRTLSASIFRSHDRHPGAVHEESFLRYPSVALLCQTASVAVGCAGASVEIVRERLPVTKVFGTTPRIESPLSRVRWGYAHQKVVCAELLLEKMRNKAIDKGEAGDEFSYEELGQLELDGSTAVHLSQEAIGDLCDGIGSSMYKSGDPLQRYRRDVNVIANHVFHERDICMERATRLVLGLGPVATDPLFLRRNDRDNAVAS
jgi:3-hydroxy-9,10-secoandrosta-1,3,5(10)-triene-9,17-dione monooxygenase